jgi:UDP-N-acetylglucosamine 1-carboxyvinyltransferase
MAQNLKTNEEEGRCYIINGGKKLSGRVKIEAAKNAVLPIIAAAVLSPKPVILRNVPKLSDIDNLIEIINKTGGKAHYIFLKTKTNLYINTTKIKTFKVDESLAKTLRSSIFLLGSCLAKFKQVEIALPGGCKIGERPIDLHILGLTKLGAKCEIIGDKVFARINELKGSEIFLPFPSVGATINILQAACMAKGETKIFNPAREPEITDLANFLNKLGLAKIKGAGSKCITITPFKFQNAALFARINAAVKNPGTPRVKNLAVFNAPKLISFAPIKDRIAAGTYLAAIAATGGKGETKGVPSKYLKPFLKLLEKLNYQIKTKGDLIKIFPSKTINETQRKINIITKPYPAFPTDLGAIAIALITTKNILATFTETIFEARFQITNELNKMGADIETKGRRALINKTYLASATVSATDLRAGAALIIAALSINGTTKINNIHFIERGYNNIEKILTTLGANITKK